MKVINLDKFKTEQTVLLDGTEYTVRGITVEQWLDEVGEEDNEKELDTKEQFERYISQLAKLSTIPTEVLRVQQFPVLTALMQIAQGLDPEAKDESEGK